MNNKVLFFGFLFAVLFLKNCFGMLNPAAVYCEALGYRYLIEEGLCELPNGQRVIDWDFLKGKVAQEYSYCVREGYQIKTVDDPEKCVGFLTEECGFCVLPNGTEVEVTELMSLKLEEGLCGDGKCVLGETYESCPEDCPEPEEKSNETEEKLPEETPVEKPEVPELREEKLCGNKICDSQESYKNCPEDCPSGSKDGYCDKVKDGVCDIDCKQGEDPDCPKNENIAPKGVEKQENNLNIWFFISLIFVLLVLVLVLIAIFKRKPKSFIQEKVENLQEQK
ncbi:MAG: DUF333 domain-containing protein [Candidatus Woesearchaeota archaeon]